MEEIEEISMKNTNKESQLISNAESKSIKSILDKDLEKFEIFEESIGINIDVFYTELLNEILINVGFNITEVVVEQLFYLRDAFELDIEKHEDLLAEAKIMEIKKTLLGVEIKRGVNLPLSKGSNAINPFVTLYLESNKNAMYETSVKFGCRDPTWGELFFLPLADKSNEDTLNLTIWNFNTKETGIKKIWPPSEEKNTDSLRLRKKEVMSKITHNNLLIGTISISVKDVLTKRDSNQYDIRDKNNKLLESKLHVSFRLTNEIDTEVMVQEYQYLLRVIVINELENSKVSYYWWEENYSKPAEAILKLYLNKINLDVVNLNLSNWTIFSIIHADYPLSFALFRKLLNNLIELLDLDSLDAEIKSRFWNGLKNILPSCFDIIRNIRNERAGDRQMLKLINDVLSLLGKISKLNIPVTFKLFPQYQYYWFDGIDSYDPDAIKNVTVKAIEEGAYRWFHEIIEDPDDNENDEGQIQFVVEILELCKSDLRNAINHYDRCFIELVNLHYSKIIYAIYKNEISIFAKPIIEKVIKNLQNYEWRLLDNSFYYVKSSNVRKRYSKVEESLLQYEYVVKEETLLRLYITLQKFLRGHSINNTKLNCHRWFLREIPRWLDMAICKTINGIEKLTSMDKFESNYETVNYSSSAVDTITLIHDVKLFWEKLAWPDIEDTYMFTIKIIEDVSHCCCFYVDEMIKKMTTPDTTSDDLEKYQTLEKWCFPINNSEFVIKKFHEFIEEFKPKEKLEQLAEIKCPDTLKWCDQTFQKSVDNCIDKLKGKLLELLNHVVKKMIIDIHYKIVYENTVENNWTAGSIKFYLETKFDMFSKRTDEKIVDMIAEMLITRLENVFSDFHRKFLMDKKTWMDFENCHIRLQEINEFFTNININSNKYLHALEDKFRIFGLETSDLIYYFYASNQQRQVDLSNSLYGELSVKAYIHNSQIQIEILNARNLQSSDFNGKVNSHIKIKFYPKTISNTRERLKTKICQNNTHPLYQDMFVIDLIAEEQNRQDGLIVFHLKRDNYFGYQAKYVAFAILPISQINSDCGDFSALQQTHLRFQKPSADDADIINSLKHRNNDIEARKMHRLLAEMQDLPS